MKGFLSVLWVRNIWEAGEPEDKWASSHRGNINHCFVPSVLCFDFLLFELFLRPPKEKQDDLRLFPHFFAHYLGLVSATAVLVFYFPVYCSSCLPVMISACFLVLCLVQFVLNPSFPQNSRSSSAELSSSHLLEYLPTFPARFWVCSWILSGCRGVVISIPHNKKKASLVASAGWWLESCCTETHSKGKWFRQWGSLQRNSLMLEAITGTAGSSITGCLP